MSTVTSEFATLDDTLNKLENALLTPAVPGELQSWIATVKQSATTFAMDWARYLHTVIHAQYAEIVKTDPEMSAFVQKMKSTDQQLLDQLASFHEDFGRLEERAKQAQWNEGKLADDRRRLEEGGIALILQIKKQRLTAEAWLSEAFYRDRGVKD